MKNTLHLFLLFVVCLISGLQAQTVIVDHNFNTSNNGWTSGGSVGGATWVRNNTSFAGLNATNHWHISPFNNYGVSNGAHLTSSTFDFTGSSNMTLSVDIRYNTEAGFDGMNLYYSTNSGTTWVLLGAVGSGTNWYNNTGVDGINDQYLEVTTDPNGWSGDNGAVQTATIGLPGALDNNANVLFRFYFGSDISITDEGVAIDNFQISVPCNSPTATFTQTCASNSSYSLSVYVSDLGDATAVDITDGTTTFETSVDTGTYVITGQTGAITFSVIDDADPGCLVDSLIPACPPPGNTCALAVDLGAETSPLSGNNQTANGFTDNISTSCITSGANDYIAYIDVADGELLTIQQDINSFDSEQRVAYGGACPGNVEIDCWDDPDTKIICWENITGSTQRVYYVVDGLLSTAEGNFNLSWSITTPGVLVGNTCLNALDLSTVTSPYNGSTDCAYTNDISTSCITSGANDFIAYIDVPDGQFVSIGQTSNTFDSEHRVAYGGACPGTNEIVCQDFDTDAAIWANTTGSTQRVYYVVDGFFSTDRGDFVLEWALDTTPAGSQCSDPAAFCAPVGTSIQFEAQATGVPAELGNDYNCLATQPDPTWFYLKIGSPGDLDIDIVGSSDIDFALWGPFADLADAIDSCGSLSNAIDCSYSTSAFEQANIVGAATDEIYLMVLTNYAGVVQTITVSLNASSTGSTDCTIATESPCKCGEGSCDGAYNTSEAVIDTAFDAMVAGGSQNPIYCYDLAMDSIPTDDGLPYEFCYEFVIPAGVTQVGFNYTYYRPIDCGNIGWTSSVYDVNCDVVLDNGLTSAINGDPLYTVVPGNTYRFCQSVSLDAADPDCTGGDYSNVCFGIYSEEPCDAEAGIWE